jgi:hypothetical protein
MARPIDGAAEYGLDRHPGAPSQVPAARAKYQAVVHVDRPRGSGGQPTTSLELPVSSIMSRANCRMVISFGLPMLTGW